MNKNIYPKYKTINTWINSRFYKIVSKPFCFMRYK